MAENDGLGFKPMINRLCGVGHGEDALKDAIGKVIQSVNLIGDGDGELHIRFTDGTGIRVFDDGSSCCESRYLHTDDDLSVHVGAQLLSLEERDGPTVDDGEDGDYHEMQFLVVTTSRGAFTVETHNEHNGYYGGFWIKVAALPEEVLGQ